MSSVLNSGGQTTGRDEEMLLLEPSGDNMNIEITPSTLVLLNKSDDKTPPLQLGEFKSLKQFGTECPLQYNIEAMEDLQKFMDKHHNLTGWEQSLNNNTFETLIGPLPDKEIKQYWRAVTSPSSRPSIVVSHPSSSNTILVSKDEDHDSSIDNESSDVIRANENVSVGLSMSSLEDTAEVSVGGVRERVSTT